MIYDAHNLIFRVNENDINREIYMVFWRENHKKKKKKIEKKQSEYEITQSTH